MTSSHYSNNDDNNSNNNNDSSDNDIFYFLFASPSEAPHRSRWRPPLAAACYKRHDTFVYAYIYIYIYIYMCIYVYMYMCMCTHKHVYNKTDISTTCCSICYLLNSIMINNSIVWFVMNKDPESCILLAYVVVC